METPSIRSVIISAHWVSKIDHIPKNTTLEQELTKTVDALISKGKKVYLFGDVPRFPFPPERCKYVAEGLGRSICSVPLDYIAREEKTYRSALVGVTSKRPDVHYLELRDQLCHQGRCSMIHDGMLMYRDNNHLNILGSRHIGKNVIEKFPELLY